MSGRRVVLSTATLALQEQIAEHDLPLLERALGRPVSFQVMKGRTNYLCRSRAARVLSQRRLPGVGGGLWDEITAWAGETHTGDRAELSALGDDAEVWHELTANSDQCTGRACKDYGVCFVMAMRERAQGAQLCVVNHHLYLADLALRRRHVEAALLPPHDVVIFDEAHELEETSCQHFGVSVSERRLTELCRELGRASPDGAEARRLEARAAELELRGGALFDALPFGAGRLPLDNVPRGALGALHLFGDTLTALEGELSASATPEVSALARRVASLGHELRFVLEGDAGISLVSAVPDELAQPDPEASPDPRPRFVRFTELHGRTRAVLARPIDVSALLGETLAAHSAILVSATLSVKRSFSFVRQRLGVPEAAGEILVDSPFDFATQAGLYVAEDLPEPDAPGFTAAAAERAADLAQASGGGSFVLCTSHRALPVMAAALKQRGLTVLVQGDAPKSRLLESFRRHGDAALVATQSFWQGVDVPGSALRLVIIDKLPFSSPGDPLLSARLQDMKARGQEPFRTYQLPQAALMLRQGFGRLIRRKTDRGVVAILDGRLLSRSYGRLLLAALPAAPRLSLEETRAKVAANRPG